MKSTFTNVILFFLMLFLIAAIAILGMSIYMNVLDINQVETVQMTNSIVNTSKENIEKKPVSENKVNQSQIDKENIHLETIGDSDKEQIGYFFEQLTDTQKKIYNGLLENKNNMRNGTYKIHYGGIFADVLEQEGGDEILGRDYQSAVETFLYDNPDVFYVDANKLFLSVETTSTIFKKTYNVSVGPAENQNYYVDGFTSEAQVNSAINKIEEIKDEVLIGLTGDTYKDIMKIHDYLVESIDYDKEYKSIGSYSIYGAFIDRKCVCEGYAKALKYLLNAANIDCVLAQGTAINSSGETENHAWNIVNLKGKWYYIDATWNDPIIIGTGHVAKSIQYRYFLKGSKTLNKDHTLSYKFSEKGRIYRYPSVEEYDYK